MKRFLVVKMTKRARLEVSLKLIVLDGVNGLLIFSFQGCISKRYKRPCQIGSPLHKSCVSVDLLMQSSVSRRVKLYSLHETVALCTRKRSEYFCCNVDLICLHRFFTHRFGQDIHVLSEFGSYKDPRMSLRSTYSIVSIFWISFNIRRCRTNLPIAGQSSVYLRLTG